MKQNLIICLAFAFVLVMLEKSMAMTREDNTDNMQFQVIRFI